MIGQDTFSAPSRPRSLTKKLAVSPSSTSHRGQHDAKYVAFELLLHAVFVADEIWGDICLNQLVTRKSPSQTFRILSFGIALIWSPCRYPSWAYSKMCRWHLFVLLSVRELERSCTYLIVRTILSRLRDPDGTPIAGQHMDTAVVTKQVDFFCQVWPAVRHRIGLGGITILSRGTATKRCHICLLYTSDAADE